MEQRDPRTYSIIGTAMEVHRKLGCGFLEAVYQESLAIEFAARSIPYRAQAEIPVFYRNTRLSANYRADFICYEDVIVELKAVENITNIELAQIHNYLKATWYQVGLLLNFGAVSLQYKRYILCNPISKHNISTLDFAINDKSGLIK